MARPAGGGIDAADIDARLHKGRSPFAAVCADADRRSDQQPALAVLGRQRKLDRFLDVLDRDQAHKALLIIDDKKLFDAVLVEDLRGFVAGHSRPRRDEAAAGHDLGHAPVQVAFETYIAVGEYPDKPVVLADR